MDETSRNFPHEASLDPLRMVLKARAGGFMKLFLGLLLFLMVRQSQAQSHHVPRDAGDQGPHLPSVGSSLFDKIYSKTSAAGPAVYQVPFPLDRLVGRVTDLDGDFVHAHFPFSRSLQRPQDLSYDPLMNPRIVLAPTKDRDSLTRGKLFFGYVKAKDQLEIISFNDEAGRFEYQIVTDYSRNPKVFYVDRGKCLSCHQDQAPIFSPPGWQDSTAFGPMGTLVRAKLGLDDRSQENQRLVLQLLFGPVHSREAVATVDSLVREANQIALDERTWVHGCGDDGACRLGLLLNTLSPQSDLTSEYLRHARAVIPRSALQRQDYYSSFLTSSSFGVEGVIQNYGSAAAVVNSPQAIMDIIGLLFRLAPADNPATPRLRSLEFKDLVGPLASFLTSDKDVLRSEIPDPNRIAKSLIHLYEAGDPMFAQSAINKLRVMRALLIDAGSPLAEKYDRWLKVTTPEKVLFRGILPPVFQRSELNIFSRHCASCHGGGLTFPPQFLAGTEDEVIAKMRALKGRVLFKLEGNLMPPNRSDRALLRDSGDYDRLVDYIKGL